ncbi:MAG: succinate dehydrogenase, cytochrome b556 subunit [Acetobacteraceae bacterium]|nr:succinate dehydrogenase, cytochrome b556 subunit [Acetobacteraceae bacterium]MBV8520664.1 succinate dehydrogenase, cytochrome b556 subunit [Acetobacteraceae bacterium]
MADVRDALLVARNSEGKIVKRPLSPHLQVYKPEITTTLSIFHRATGVWVSIGTLLLVWWLVAAATSPEAYGRVQGFIGSWFGLLLMFSWTAALFYHFFAGIRHLAWDAGYGYDKPIYAYTGWAAVIATGICTVLIWIIGLAVW